MASGPIEPVHTISTHVLDTELGQPAVGVHVTLFRLSDDGRPLRLTQALTDAEGRIRDLLERPLVIGDYRLEFALAPGDPVDTVATKVDVDRFFRRIAIDLHVGDANRSYHVPLLLAPFSMTTYRGT